MSCVTLMRWGNAESALVPAVGFKGNDSVRFGREVDPVGGVVADVPVVNWELEGASADGEIPPGAALHMSAGGTGLSVASYTNSMFYKIADPLEVRMDITLQGSPFGPTAGADRNNLSKLYVSRLQMNYQPWKDVFLQLQYRESPYFFNRDFTDPFTFGHPWGDR